MTPRATYRLQLHREFDFDAAARLVPYLRALGVSHVYTSPCLRARPGSRHGYDIVAHDEVNPELGGEAALQRFSSALRAAGMGHVADIVPNHMGVWGADNRLWLDILAWGEDSRYAGWFDIDWEPDRRYLQGKLLAPILGDQYGIELEAGHLKLRFDAQGGEFALWCYDAHKLPICPLHYESILGDEHYGLQELGDDFSALPEWRPQMALRAAELQQRLAALVAAEPEARAALDAALARLNGSEAASRAALDGLIQRQHWRATHFRVAGDDINYRRFFNVSELAGLRVELPAVFDHVHQLPLRWLAAGIVDGLRVDHIDGLLDPPGYLQRLRGAADAAFADPEAATPATPYLVVEKILARDESLPEDWPVDGTTGYEFGALVGGWLIDPAGRQALDALYERAWEGDPHWPSILRASKLQIMDNEMSAELNVLARDAARVARQSSRTADFTGNILRRAIRAFIAALPVYRTYMHANGELGGAELERLQAAIAVARGDAPELDPSVFDFLLRLLTGALVGPRSAYTRHTVIRCARKLQQYSGPVMAKGLEDTALFRYSRLVALNEVGTDPALFGRGSAELHVLNRSRAPRTLLGTSTHDTKWGEDARARLAVLSEWPAAWADFTAAALNALSGAGSEAAPRTAAAARPARIDLYALLQRLLASWPEAWTVEDAPLAGHAEYAARLKAATVKSLREGKLRSSWSMPDEDYERQLEAVIDGLLDWLADDAAARRFLAQVAALGARNSLAQLTLKLTVPGIPDFYQGSESWNFSLLDPDNRRAIDFDARQRLLDAVAKNGDGPASPDPRWLEHWQDGRLKMFLTHRLLAHRREHATLYAEGAYLPLAVDGQRHDELLAFARVLGDEVLLVVVARFPARRADAPDRVDWLDTVVKLPAGLCGGGYRSLLDDSTSTLTVSPPATSLLRWLPCGVWHRPRAG